MQLLQLSWTSLTMSHHICSSGFFAFLKSVRSVARSNSLLVGEALGCHSCVGWNQWFFFPVGKLQDLAVAPGASALLRSLFWTASFGLGCGWKLISPYLQWSQSWAWDASENSWTLQPFSLSAVCTKQFSNVWPGAYVHRKARNRELLSEGGALSDSRDFLWFFGGEKARQVEQVLESSLR